MKAPTILLVLTIICVVHMSYSVPWLDDVLDGLSAGEKLTKGLRNEFILVWAGGYSRILKV